MHNTTPAMKTSAADVMLKFYPQKLSKWHILYLSWAIFILVLKDLFYMYRLLHAAPEEEEREEEYSDTQQEITSSLSELYQSSTAGSSGNLRSKKREYKMVLEVIDAS